MRRLIKLLLAWRTQKAFAEMLRAWEKSLPSGFIPGGGASFFRLDTEFETAARRRYTPSLSIVVDSGNLPHIYYPLNSSHPQQATLLRPLGRATVGTGGHWREFNFGDAHRLGMLARCSTGRFIPMVNRLTCQGDAYRNQLLRLIDDPSYLPDALVRTPRVDIEQWANYHLPTLWGKAARIKRHFDARFEHWARISGVPESRVRALLDANIRVLIAHDRAWKDFDAIFRGKAGTVFDELQRSDWSADVVKRVVGITASQALADDQHGLRELFEMILEYRIRCVTDREGLRRVQDSGGIIL